MYEKVTVIPTSSQAGTKNEKYGSDFLLVLFTSSLESDAPPNLSGILADNQSLIFPPLHDIPFQVSSFPWRIVET